MEVYYVLLYCCSPTNHHVSVININSKKYSGRHYSVCSVVLTHQHVSVMNINKMDLRDKKEPTVS